MCPSYHYPYITVDIILGPKKTVDIILVANFTLIIHSLFHLVNDVNASNSLNNWSKSSSASSLNTHILHGQSIIIPYFSSCQA